MSLSFPTLPDGLDLPRGISSSSTPLAGGDLGWGPRKRHLVFNYIVPLFLWGRNHAASRRTIGVCTLGYLNRSKRAGLYFYGKLQIQQEAWYERQTGQDRQSGHSCTGVSEQRPKVFFLPLM